jgi:hypothetical protein
MGSEERMVCMTGKRMQNTTICHSLVSLCSSKAYQYEVVLPLYLSCMNNNAVLLSCVCDPYSLSHTHPTITLTLTITVSQQSLSCAAGGADGRCVDAHLGERHTVQCSALNGMGCPILTTSCVGRLLIILSERE